MKKTVKLAVLFMAAALMGMTPDQGFLPSSSDNTAIVLADSHTSTTKASTKTKIKKSTKNKKLNRAKKTVKQLEDDQTRSNLAYAKATVDNLPDSTQKEALNQRINLVEQNIVNEEAKTAVKNLEDNHNRDNLQAARNQVNLVSDEETKADLNNRTNLVEQAILITEADDAVKYLEDNQSRDNIANATDKTNLVNDKGTKASLQNRITLVENAISTKELTEQQAQAQAQAQAPAAQQDDTTQVYITRTGKRYHFSPGCPGLNNAKSTTQVTLSDAEARGLTKCQRE